MKNSRKNAKSINIDEVKIYPEKTESLYSSVVSAYRKKENTDAAPTSKELFDFMLNDLDDFLNGK